MGHIARIIFYVCALVACFACLGTFASYLFTNRSLSNPNVPKILKITCPMVMIAAFILMSLARCFMRQQVTNAPNSHHGQGNVNGMSNEIRGQGNGGYQWFESGIAFLPSYSESINRPQDIFQDPPPKYEEIMLERVKPDGENDPVISVQQEYRQESSSNSTIFRIIEIVPTNISVGEVAESSAQERDENLSENSNNDANSSNNRVS